MSTPTRFLPSLIRSVLTPRGRSCRPEVAGLRAAREDRTLPGDRPRIRFTHRGGPLTEVSDVAAPRRFGLPSIAAVLRPSPHEASSLRYRVGGARGAARRPVPRLCP